MFKRLKGSIGKNDEPKTPNSVPQNRPTWSGFSTISPLNPGMEDSQFCINDDIEETPKNSPARVVVSESTTVDLGKFSQSSSSLVNDHLSFHTDIESASEIDDSVSVVSEYANEITKENLYAAYKKLHGRYHKHKFKYTELADKFKQTVTIHDKDKITMTKAQDKLLQRIAELKEQCTLEQAAKAHMEDALRNDIEERDHIISTLNTKIDLLRKNSSDECESTSILSGDLLAKCERLNDELSSTKAECASLENQIELLKKSEETTLLSLAENKMAIHKELETKEDQIKKLEKTINGLQMENQILLKEKASHLSTNSYQININQNVQEEITKQLNELEGEMSSAFEFKENEVKELKNQLKALEQRCEVQEQKNISMEEVLKNKENDYKSVISSLEQNLNDIKISSSKKIDTFLKEIGEKSLVIKNLTVKLKEMEKVKQDYEKNKNEIHDLKNQILQSKKLVKENELIRVDEQNRCIEELKLKSEEISHFKNKLELLQHTLKENEKKNLDLQTHIDEISFKNKSLMESEEELKMTIFNYKKSNDELQDTIKLLQKEKEIVIDSMKTKMDENQLEIEKLNNLNKEMLCQLNQDKLIKISEERSIESVIKDYNLLTEENAYLKKERQKMLQTFQDMLKKIKVDFGNLKSFAEEQLKECSLIFVKHIEHLKAEYSSKIKLYHNNLTETKQKLEVIQNAYLILKSDCVQSLDCFKIEIEKYNEGIMLLISQNNNELEKRNLDLLRLQEEIESYKKSEHRSVKAEVKETIQELQECIEVQKKTYTNLQDEYSNYQVSEKKKWTDKLIETENKWLEKMDNYKKMMDTEHREEIEALTNEWTNEQKHNALSLMTADNENEETLEKIIQDVETTSQREEALQRQITKLNKELSELKKINEIHNKHRNNEGDDDDNDDNNKDGCEMEYLRNILYEYMMGKQPMVLAKVLAAIVKFDSNQLSTILQKEEQKVSLLKTLGL
ncbi:golgin subfamily A member 4 isoform X2 [Acyrthosiphon pisum]|uniref:GRIP domain-containing protein n=1 Tax=Acyrthosiphon pisum TaxID=7029 RepID=A0A8R2F6Y3_ACYPI|nr:golgin subfamily A member 4 isoform X2 [Acyrthosiphon pisum]|eukprot:XP_008181437.1 PREDICTED: golgin subfamily A member 4 isoform X2 [Acyrthosiphon pisum]